MANETREHSIAQWLRAAEREQLAEHEATAITYRNMAWLLEHSDMWIPKLTPSATQQVINYLNEWDDVT